MSSRHYVSILSHAQILLLSFVLFAVSVACGCGSTRGVAVTTPASSMEPRVEAAGDVQQTLESMQRTLTRIEKQQQSQVTELAGSIEGVQSLVQNVEKRMYGTSPEDAEIQIERNRKNAAIVGGGVVAVLGLILVAFGHGVAGATLIMLAGFIGMGLGAMAIVLALFFL